MKFHICICESEYSREYVSYAGLIGIVIGTRIWDSEEITFSGQRTSSCCEFKKQEYDAKVEAGGGEPSTCRTECAPTTTNGRQATTAATKLAAVEWAREHSISSEKIQSG